MMRRTGWQFWRGDDRVLIAIEDVNEARAIAIRVLSGEPNGGPQEIPWKFFTVMGMSAGDWATARVFARGTTQAG